MRTPRFWPARNKNRYSNRFFAPEAENLSELPQNRDSFSISFFIKLSGRAAFPPGLPDEIDSSNQDKPGYADHPGKIPGWIKSHGDHKRPQKQKACYLEIWEEWCPHGGCQMRVTAAEGQMARQNDHPDHDGVEQGDAEKIIIGHRRQPGERRRD